MKILLVPAAFVILALTSCTPATNNNPDQIRQRTADATAAARRDAKAVAQGIRDGMERKGPVDINTANREQLLALPGITPAQADAIIARRPYSNSSQLVRKHILSKAEYNKIADRIEAKQ